jgi:hypothetical protein
MVVSLTFCFMELFYPASAAPAKPEKTPLSYSPLAGEAREHGFMRAG